VLESGDPGFGASTRNHGHVGGAGKLPKALAAQVGEARAATINADAVRAADYMRALVHAHRDEVEYVQHGRFIGAHSRPAFAALATRAEAYRRELGLTVDVVPEAAQRSEIGSDFYCGGITIAEAGALHPGKLHALMRRLAEAAGAELRGNAGVQRIERRGTGFRLHTARGLVEAERVVVATNAYTGKLTPFIRRRLVPVTAYMMATEPMDADLAATTMIRNRTGGDTKRALYAFRRSPDGRRIIFAGRAKFRDIGEREASGILHRFMCGIWPQLGAVRVSHCWKGFVAFTFDGLPHMGEQDGLHYAAGCQGAGIAMMTWLGHQLGLKLLGRQERPVGLDGLHFPTRPTYTGRPWFLPAVGGYYKMRDAIDRKLSGKPVS
jgi:glycine/D-amino acid oxidase-like deaminating enzyme